MGPASPWLDQHRPTGGRSSGIASSLKNKGEPSIETRTAIYDMRTEAGLSQPELAERMETTQSVISRLEDGGGAKNRIGTLARVATALDRHLVLSFPVEFPTSSPTQSKLREMH